jgi:hypothetical protein
MDDNHYSFYRPHMKRNGSVTSTAAQSMHRKSVSTLSMPKPHYLPLPMKFEYSEPQHKSRETSQNLTNTLSKLNPNRSVSSLSPSPNMMNHQSKKMVKFLDLSNSTPVMKSENHSTDNDISRILKMREITGETTQVTDSMLESVPSDKLRERLGMKSKGLKL